MGRVIWLVKFVNIFFYVVYVMSIDVFDEIFWVWYFGMCFGFL